MLEEKIALSKYTDSLLGEVGGEGGEFTFYLRHYPDSSSCVWLQTVNLVLQRQRRLPRNQMCL